MRKMLFAAVLAAAATFGVAFAGDVKSGPQTGDTVPGPFHPLNVNGESAGKKACMYCKHGDNPVAVIFARSSDCAQTVKLIKKLDELTAKNDKAEMGSYAVFLSDDDKMADKLAELAKKEGIKNLTITVDAGPTRHGATRGCGLYFFDPAGNRNELYTGGYWFDPDDEPTTWTENEMGRESFITRAS